MCRSTRAWGKHCAKTSRASAVHSGPEQVSGLEQGSGPALHAGSGYSPLKRWEDTCCGWVDGQLLSRTTQSAVRHNQLYATQILFVSFSRQSTQGMVDSRSDRFTWRSTSVKISTGQLVNLHDRLLTWWSIYNMWWSTKVFIDLRDGRLTWWSMYVMVD